jgi:hypothetical protein
MYWRIETLTASRRWVMSTTTHVSLVSDVPARLADQAKASMSVPGVSRRLFPVPAGLVSEPVSRRASWPAAFRVLGMHQSSGTVFTDRHDSSWYMLCDCGAIVGCVASRECLMCGFPISPPRYTFVLRRDGLPGVT